MVETEKRVKKYAEMAKKHSVIAVVGPYFHGKSHAFSSLDYYIDFEKLGFSPEDFVQDFLGMISYYFLKKDVLDIASLKRIKNLVAIKDKFPEKARDLVLKVANELEKRKPDQRALVEWALKFPDMLNKKITLVLDEFWMLEQLNNFSQIKDVFSFFKGVIDSYENVNLVLVGSAVWLSNRICSELNIKVEDFSGDFFALRELRKDKKEFIKSALVKDERLNLICKEILGKNLARARGQSLLRSILKIVSSADGLRLSEVSSLVYRSSGVTQNLLQRLMEVDLIEKKEGEFFVPEFILKYYISHVWNGVEFIGDIPDKTMKKLMEEL